MLLFVKKIFFLFSRKKKSYLDTQQRQQQANVNSNVDVPNKKKLSLGIGRCIMGALKADEADNVMVT